MKLKILTLLLIGLIPGDAPATPSLNSVPSLITDGGTASVVGQSFGTKVHAAPLKFENFEVTDAGSAPTVDQRVASQFSYWTDRPQSYGDGKPMGLTISDAKKRTDHSSYAAKSYMAVANGAATHSQQLWKNGVGWHNTGKVYLNMRVWWAWVANPTFDNEATYYQLKSFLVGTGISSNGDPVRPYIDEFATFYWGPPKYTTATEFLHRNGRVSHPDQSLKFDNDSIPANYSGWVNVVLISNPGTNISDGSSTDGWRIVQLSPTTGGTPYQVKTETGKNYLDDAAVGADPIDALKIGWYLGNNLLDGNTSLYYDDIYLDDTFQRVEIGDAPVYASCTKREIQIPTAWTDTDITFTVNRGAFNNGDTAYIFIIDQDNNVTSGGSTTFGVLPVVSSVTGTLAEGETIAVNGTNFGSHADYNSNRSYLNAGWENFESGVADSVFTANYGPELVVGGSAQKANSSYAARGYYWATPHTYTNVWGRTLTAATMYGFHLNPGASNFQKRIFISGWFMFPTGFDTGIRTDTGATDQTKFLALSPLGTLHPGDGAKTYFQTRSATPNIPLRTETEDGYPSEGDTDPLFNYAPMGTWHRYDIYVDLNKADGAKIHNWYVDGKKIARNHPFYNNDAALATNGLTDGFNYLSWLMFQFQGTDSPTWFQYLDDAFADYTQARVEISDRSSWNEAVQSVKHIQIPYTWSGTQILAKANLGTFNSTQPLYLYVIDEDGKASPPYPLRNGSTSPVCDSSHKDLCLTAPDCTNAGGYFYGGTCHADPLAPSGTRYRLTGSRPTKIQDTP